MNAVTRAPLDDIQIHVKFKLSALWTAVTFCYIYGDYFGLFKPGALQSMLDGRMGPLGPTTQGVLLGTTAMLAVPCLMPFVSLVLRPAINRYVNIFLGFGYSIIMLLTLPGAWMFYQALGVVEIVLTMLVTWYAWTWPRESKGA